MMAPLYKERCPLAFDRRRFFLTGLATVLVLGGCLVASRLTAVQDFITNDIILPGLYVYWLLGLLVRTLHQALLWGLGLAALGALVLYGLGFTLLGRPAPRAVKRPSAESLPPERGRVAYWRHHARILRSQGVESEFATYEFRRLAHSILDLQGGSSAGLEELDGALLPADIPPEIRTFFVKNRRSAPLPTQKKGWLRWLPDRQRKQPDPKTDPLEALAGYLENHLEVPHDFDD